LSTKCFRSCNGAIDPSAPRPMILGSEFINIISATVTRARNLQCDSNVRRCTARCQTDKYLPLYHSVTLNIKRFTLSSGYSCDTTATRLRFDHRPTSVRRMRAVASQWRRSCNRCISYSVAGSPIYVQQSFPHMSSISEILTSACDNITV